MSKPARFPRLPARAVQRQGSAKLKQGGLLAYATESCYGLGCRPDDARALMRLLRLKKRPKHKGLIVIAANIAQLRPLIQPLSPEQWATLVQYWPGPYTFLLPAAKGVLPALRGHHDKIAVRLTAHPGAAALCRHWRTALVSTSANRAGQKPLRSVRACRLAFGKKVLSLPGKVGPQRQPSTIIDLASKHVLR